MDRRLIAMRLAAPVLASLAIACGFGADATGGGTGDSGTAMGSSSTAGEAAGCGAENTNSLLVAGACFCMPGTIWTDPFDPFGYSCEPPKRLWPPCRKYASDAEGKCDCAQDCRTLPEDADCANPVAGEGPSQNQCVVPNIYTCNCPPDLPDVACTCPSVYTCTCPAFYTWCSYEALDNVSCCYDPAQDPDGSHAPSSTDSSTSAGDTSSGDTGSGEIGSGDTCSGTAGSGETAG